VSLRRQRGSGLDPAPVQRAGGRDRRLARRQRAAQMAGRTRRGREARGATRGRDLRATRPCRGGRRARPRREPPAIHARVPRYAESEILGPARSLPRSVRRRTARPRPHFPRVRRPLHRAAARLSRCRALLELVLEWRVARADPRADAPHQCPQRSVPAGAGAARRLTRRRALRDARVSARRRPCRLRPRLAQAAPHGFPASMKLPAEIFRTYDIRGIVGRTLTAPIVRDIGRALGSLGRERNAATFAVCRDGRLSGPELLSALTDGLLAAGADVVDVGMAPTPIAYFAA